MTTPNKGVAPKQRGQSAQRMIREAGRSATILALAAEKEKKAKGITGRDDYILSEALATAIAVLSRLEHPPESNIADMKEILADWYPTGGFGHLIESAERRLDTLLPTA